jgi:hypothetical protein
MVDDDSEFILQKISIQERNVIAYRIEEKVVEKGNHSQ